VAAAFAIGYEFSATRLGFLAFVFCGFIELLQVQLPTRHARLTDFVIDFVASCFGIGLIFFWKKTFTIRLLFAFFGNTFCLDTCINKLKRKIPRG
jgi:VanZ family protein